MKHFIIGFFIFVAGLVVDILFRVVLSFTGAVSEVANQSLIIVFFLWLVFGVVFYFGWYMKWKRKNEHHTSAKNLRKAKKNGLVFCAISIVLWVAVIVVLFMLFGMSEAIIDGLFDICSFFFGFEGPNEVKYSLVLVIIGALTTNLALWFNTQSQLPDNMIGK